MKSNDPSFQEEIYGNPSTHNHALGFESEVMSDIENDHFGPRRGETPRGGDLAFYFYDGTKNRVSYIIGLTRNEQGQVINNVKTVQRIVVPQ